MTGKQFVIFTLILALSLHVTRFLPFLLMGKKDRLPSVIEYMGNVLPAAVSGLLVVYCLKDLDFSAAASWVPAIVSCAAVMGLQRWKHNTVLSIVLGTGLYMLLIRL